MFKVIGTDLSADLVNTAENPSDPLNTGAQKLYNKAVGPIEKGFNHTVAELEKGHSEVTPEKAASEVQTLWDTIRRDNGIAMVSALGIECASLGQIEGLYSSYQTADKISGATAFASTVAMMKYKAQWLNAYERYLNWTNPNNIPGPSDIVRFALREVYDPTRREEELRETPGLGYYQDMLENGYGQTQSDNYWASHWVLPSVGQLNDMLHRRVIDEKVWDRFVKYNDFDPTVRPWLKAISYEPYTRVDVRRMWELGLVTDQELIDTYKDLGYDDTHAQRLALWTKIYVIVPDLRARYQKGWISSEEVRNALLQEGMPADRVENYMQQIVKADSEARTETERNLTKAEIVKGYKNNTIDYPTALSMLKDMGYDEDEASYILVVNTSVAKEVAPEAPKGLTKAEIIKGYKLGIISYDTAFDKLVALNYTREDAAYLLKIGVPTEET